MKKIACLSALICVLVPLCDQTSADEREVVKVIQRAKSATALVQIERRVLGTASCLSSSGWFVTNMDVLGPAAEGTQVKLVLNASEVNQKVIQAKIMRMDRTTGFALLQAPGDGFDFLPLGNEDGLFETKQVTAFGYPVGGLPVGEDDYPSAIVTAGRITSLYKSKGQVVGLQLDKKLNPGSSGGPVIDAKGNLIGIVRFGIRGSAVPAIELRRFVERPVITLETATIDEADSHEEQRLGIRINSLRELPADRQVELEIQVGKSKPRRFEAREDKDGNYSVIAVLVPEQNSPDLLHVDAEFPHGSVSCRIADMEVKVGSVAIRLGEILRVEFGDDGDSPKVILDGRILRGPVTGLKRAKVDFGNVSAKLDLTKATRMTFKPIVRTVPIVNYRIVVRDGEKVIGEDKGTIAIRPSDENVREADSPSESVRVTPARLAEGGMTVKLPAPIDEVVVGAAGRLLILHLKKLQQLAVFDVSKAKVVKYLPLVSNDISYAAGARKLFVGARDLGVIQRWDLTTLERELTVNAPEGGIRSMAMGSGAISPLILLASQGAKRSYLVNPSSMKAEPLQWKGWRGGAWGPVNVHVSFDGSTAVVCGGGWAGIEVATISGGQITSSQAGSYVNGDTLVAGNGALIFPTKGGILRRDLVSNVEGIEGVPFPAHSPSFSLAFLTRDDNHSLSLFCNNDPKRIATIRDVPILGVNSRLPIQQRVHLIPTAKVLALVGEGNDHLILRPFDLERELNKEGIDYLFVESTPLRQTTRGAKYNYPIIVRSRKGDVTYSLQSAPEGMKISNDGILTWDVPQNYEGDEVAVIVLVSNAAGQDTFQNFSLIDQVSVGGYNRRASRVVPTGIEGS